MSIHLLHHVSDKITDATISKLSSIMQLETETIRLAVDACLPILLQAVVRKGGSTDEASALRGFIRTQNIASNVATDFLNLDRDSTREYIGIGDKCVEYLLQDERSSIETSLEEKTGMEKHQSNLLNKLITPLALGHVSKLGNRENMTDAQFSNYLKSEMTNLMNPEERKTADANNARRSREAKKEENPIEAPVWLKWLIPALGAAALIWWSGQKACSSSIDGVAEKTEIKAEKSDAPSSQKTQKTNSTETESMHTKREGWYVNDNGDLIDANGEISKKAGAFSVTGGYYVDTNGKSLSPVNNPLDKSTDEFKKNFSNMFMNKKSVGTRYTLSQIEFDKTSHTIKQFSKREVEGLANALRTIPGAKIEVQVHSNDGADNTKLRAQVVKDMLVTLGVSKDQISSKGMGNQEKAKADLDKVEIRVLEIK